MDLAIRIKEKAHPYLGVDEEYPYLSAGGDTARAVDEAAQEAISGWLKERKSYPDVISEESGLIEGSEEGVLLIDPIDGSSNADRGVPFAAISIAYSSSYSLKDLKIAVILDAFRGDLYHAMRGRGSFKNGNTIRVRDFWGTPVIYAPCMPDDPIMKDKLGFEYLARRDFGSVALGLALIAEGKVDALIDLRGELRIVDIAAGLLLVKEAGGMVLINGEEIRGLSRGYSVMAGIEEILGRANVAGMVRL